jgi:virulence-associated protein VagC
MLLENGACAMGEDKRATLFMIGGCQAVRLPKEIRLPGSTVRVRQVGTGVLLEPLEKRTWPAGYWERLVSLRPVGKHMTVPPPLPPSTERDARLSTLESWPDEWPDPPNQRGQVKRRKRR